jgi:hypothetical protein
MVIILVIILIELLSHETSTKMWTCNKDVDSITHTSSWMLSDYHNFLETSLGMKDTIKTWNQKLFSVKMGKLCSDATGISKTQNIGKDRLKGYNIKLITLKVYLGSKGVLDDDTTHGECE